MKKKNIFKKALDWIKFQDNHKLVFMVMVAILSVVMAFSYGKNATFGLITLWTNWIYLYWTKPEKKDKKK